MFYKVLIRNPVSSELLLFFTKTYEHINHFSDHSMHQGMHCLQGGGQRTTGGWIFVFVWCVYTHNIPWQYIAIRIVIRLSCIAKYRNTLLPYRDTPTCWLLWVLMLQHTCMLLNLVVAWLLVCLLCILIYQWDDHRGWIVCYQGSAL
jgi:hypothetical protein